MKLLGEREEWPPGQSRHFIPINKIYELVNEENVQKELESEYPTLARRDLENYTKLICASSRKLFAILICGSPQDYDTIRPILDENITDADLPFERIATKETDHPNSYNHSYTLGIHRYCKRDNHEGCTIRALSSWQPLDIAELGGRQYSFLAPVFNSGPGEIALLDLNTGSIMPFTEDLETDTRYHKTGGYSEVWPVRIHPAHHNFNIFSSANPDPRV